MLWHLFCWRLERKHLITENRIFYSSLTSFFGCSNLANRFQGIRSICIQNAVTSSSNDMQSAHRQKLCVTCALHTQRHVHACINLYVRASVYVFHVTKNDRRMGHFNPLNAELNPICHLLILLGAHHILHVSRVRVKQGNDDSLPLWPVTRCTSDILH
jgi:hypothetical protein